MARGQAHIWDMLICCLTVFSKCADYMEEGRRLENLSWRLWTRETFCVEPESSCDTSVLPLLRSEAGEVPELSASVESAASDDAERIETHIKRAPKSLDYKPAIVSEDSVLSMGRGKQQHITSLGLERMVLNIKEKKNLEPLSRFVAPVAPPVVDVTPRQSSPTPAPAPAPPPREQVESYPEKQQQQQQPQQQPHQSAGSCSTTAPEGNESDAAVAAASDTSVSSPGMMPSKPSLIKSPSIVRGFSPSHVSSSYRSQPKLAAEPGPVKTTPQPKPSPLKKKGGMFTLGGSSGDDDESSFEERMAAPGPYTSSLTEELSKPGASTPGPNKKEAAFKDDVESETGKEGTCEDEDAIETEDEISESAIEDDDDSEWEDSVTESGRSSVDDKELFQRVNSRPNLVSRRSLLTMMMHQPVRVNPTGSRSSPALQRSRLSPNGPSIPASPADDDDENLTMKGPDVPRSKPIIVKQIPQHAVAHSPRTTRRNMLATELTESLRRHLLWERQQKSSTVNAVFKRRHTANDMANLREYPGPKDAQKQGQGIGIAGANAANQAKDKDTSKNSSWNNYNDFGPWEYHVKGW